MTVRSIRSQVFISQLVMSLVVAAILGLASYVVMARIFVATARDNLLLITSEEAVEMAQRIGDNRDYFREVAREELIEFSDPRFDALGFIGHFSHFTERFENLSFIGLDGREQARMSNGRTRADNRDFSSDPLFREAFENPKRLVAADVTSEAGGSTPFLRLAYALHLGGGRKVGVIMGDLPLQRIAAVMIGRSLGQLGSTALVSANGTILWHERQDLRMATLAVGGSNDLLRGIEGGDTGFRRMEIFGGDSYVANAPVPGFPWAVLAILPYEEAMAGAVTMRNTVFTITMAVMLLGAVAAAVSTRRIVEPLRELSDAAGDVAAGELSRRVEVTGDDEVARLAGTFNVMAGRLEESYRELREQNEELRKLDRMKEALVTDIAHELRTPVAKQAMQVEILRRALGGAGEGREIPEALNVLHDNLVRQQGTIQNLLMIALLEKGGKKEKLEKVNLRVVLDGVCGEYRHAFEAFPVAVSCQLDKAFVHSDAELLRLVFSNIVENAIKYRSEGKPRIDVGLRKKEGRVTVTVSDNGIGMSGEEVEHAFERFYQASSSAPGIGVGLSLSKNIIEKLGGTIAITSAGRGEGTTVTVELPGEREV